MWDLGVPKIMRNIKTELKRTNIMRMFTNHDEKSAPEKSAKMLEKIKEKYGFVPNVMALMANSPAMLETYLEIGGRLENSGLSQIELNALYLAISVENRCEYCVAAHTSVCKMLKMSNDQIRAIREGQDVEDKKLSKLISFARKLVNKRGFVNDSDVKDFLGVGYSKEDILNVILAVSMKTLSNYLNHISGTELDEAFIEFKWRKNEKIQM